jgi:hypothetical protein
MTPLELANKARELGLTGPFWEMDRDLRIVRSWNGDCYWVFADSEPFFWGS